MKIGNISFNLDSIRGISKEDFIQRYQGQLDGIDISEAYEKLQTELNKTEEKPEEKQIKTPKKK